MEKLLIFTCTYNEADNIGSLIGDIRREVPEADVLVVDDHSPDGTGDLLDELSLKDSHVRAIHRPRKLGLGSAHKLAWKYAIHQGYDYVISMDADYSHHPKYLKRLTSMLPYHDFITGSRYMPGGKCDYGFVRSSISRLANGLTRALLNIELHECTTAYRGFRVSILQRLNIDKIHADGYSFFIESVFLISRLTKRLSEFPIHFEDRRAGTSKISKKEILHGMLTLLGLWFKRLRGNAGEGKILAPENARSLSFESKCVNCASLYHTEKYPERRNHQLQSATYQCTSTSHRSHGRIARCLQCGLTYTDPVIEEATLVGMYADVKDDSYVQNAQARFRTFEYNFDKIQNFLPKGGKLLDVGSYCGLFLKVANDRGYQAVGVDPSQWAVQYARTEMGVESYQGTVGNLPAEMQNFDVVTSWDVLEHVSDPSKELARVHSRLKPGGIFAFSTLNINNWVPRLMGERWPWMMDMHLYYFDDKVLADMLERQGFKLLSSQNYCHIITADYFASKLQSLGGTRKNYLQKLSNNRLFKNLYLPFRFGDIQMFVCQAQ